MAIANQPPVTNQAAADKNKAANAIHMQDQFKAGQAPKDASAIQKLGAAFTGEQQSQDLQATGAEASQAVADVERDQQLGEIEQAEQNIKDQAQLSQSIQDQKNEIIAMDIGITEDEFADDQMIEKLNTDLDFSNATQVNDLMLQKAQSKEEYQDMLQDSIQRVQTQVANDEWEAGAYKRLEDNKQLKGNLMKDEAVAAEMKRYAAEANQKLKDSRSSLKSKYQILNASRTIGGAIAMWFTQGAVGGDQLGKGVGGATSQTDEEVQYNGQ